MVPGKKKKRGMQYPLLPLKGGRREEALLFLPVDEEGGEKEGVPFLRRGKGGKRALPLRGNGK